MTITRRLEQLERSLASGSGEWFPDWELLSHEAERQAASQGKSLEMFLEEEAMQSSAPEREPGETWHEYLARCAAMAGVSLAEVRAELVAWEDRERALIALERAHGFTGAADPSYGSGAT